MTHEAKSMVVEFSIYPLGSAHFSEKIAKIVPILERCGLEYQVGPMGTSLRGSWDEIMSVIRTCHEALAQESERVITTLTIDDRKLEQHGLKERVDLVDHKAAS